MRATNHVLTGALIGATISLPAVALPAALASHFILDALPHFGGENHRSKVFLVELIFDALLALLFLATLYNRQPHNWLLMAGCGILAASPDLMWLPRYIKELKLGRKLKRPMNIINRFHSRIQWSERPYFWWIEFVWATATLTYLVIFNKI